MSGKINISRGSPDSDLYLKSHPFVWCTFHWQNMKHSGQAACYETIRLAAQLHRCYATVTLKLFSIINPLGLHSHTQVLKTFSTLELVLSTWKHWLMGSYVIVLWGVTSVWPRRATSHPVVLKAGPPLLFSLILVFLSPSFSHSLHLSDLLYARLPQSIDLSHIKFYTQQCTEQILNTARFVC